MGNDQRWSWRRPTFDMSGRNRVGPAKRKINLGGSRGQPGGGTLDGRFRHHSSCLATKALIPEKTRS